LKTRRRRVIEAANEAIDTYVGEEYRSGERSDDTCGGEATVKLSGEGSDDTCVGEAKAE
jgi:hypothetical protein